MNQSKSFLTVKEVAEILRLNAITVYEFIKSGSLSAVKFGKSYRIAEIDLEKFIQDHRI